jgi:lysozyme
MSLSQARQWIEAVEDRIARQVVLYSGNLIKEQLHHPDPFWNGRRLWLAQYGPKAKLPVGWSDYWLWQFSENSKLAGVGGLIDANHFPGTPEELAAQWAGASVVAVTAPAADEPKVSDQ